MAGPETQGRIRCRRMAPAPPQPLRTREASTRLVGTAGILGMVLAGAFSLVAIGYDADPVLVVLALMLALAPVPLLAAGVLWLDRFEPEPPRALFFTFAWGATVACFAALILNTAGSAVVGSGWGADAAEIYGGSISAPVVEEAAKGMAIWLIVRRRRELDGVLDGIVYAGMVGLGFAATENVLYYTQGAVEDGVEGALVTFAVRGVFSPFAHPVFTAMTGIGFGIAARSRSRVVRFVAPWAGLGLAMGLHSLWNTSTLGGSTFLGVYLLVMVPVFIAILLVARADRRREVRVIRRHAPAYIEAGWLPAGAVDELTSLTARRRARRRARADGGRGAARRVAKAQLVATELAFLRDRRERGLVGDEWQDHERAELDRLRELSVTATA